VLNLTIPLKPLQKLGQSFLNIILTMLSAKRRVCVTPPSIGIYKKRPLYSCPVSWNAAGDIRFQKNEVTFRKNLKRRIKVEVTTEITYIKFRHVC
jgi:hypothetical protein